MKSIQWLWLLGFPTVLPPGFRLCCDDTSGYTSVFDAQAFDLILRQRILILLCGFMETAILDNNCGAGNIMSQ